MKGKKLAALASVFMLGLSVTLPIPVALASEVDLVTNEQVEEQVTELSYFKINYNGTEQLFDIEEGLKLRILGWKDELKESIVAEIIAIDTEGTETVTPLDIVISEEILDYKISEEKTLRFYLLENDIVGLEQITPDITVEEFIPVEVNENGSAKEQAAVLDEKGTILKRLDTYRFTKEENEEVIIIDEEEYVALNTVIEEEVVEEEPILEEENETPEVVEETEPVVEEKVEKEVEEVEESEPQISTFAFRAKQAAPSVVYSTHVQSHGWLSDSINGEKSGTEGQRKRVEAIKVQITGLQNLGIRYSTHVQSHGWTDFVANGQISGTIGNAKRVEALKLELTGSQAANYDIYYRVHSETFGWLDWAKNGQPAGTEGLAKRVEAVEVKLVKKGAPAPGKTSNYFVQLPTVSYRSYVKGLGWQNTVKNGGLSGTNGQKKSLEAVQIGIDTQSGLNLRYSTHMQSNGWLNWVDSNGTSGLPGSNKRLEAIKIELTGQHARKFDVYYRVHVEKLGWLGWAKNGEPAGSEGYAYQTEALEVRILEKGKAFNQGGSAYKAKDKASIVYSTHVEKLGWLPESRNGVANGTRERALRVEAVKVQLQNDQYSGGLTYRTHVEKHGWMNPVTGGNISGTTGEKKRVEAIQINLTGEMAKQYDVYYRTYVQSYGWLGWAKNGMSSGTEGMKKRVEGMEIKLIEKGLPGLAVSVDKAFKKFVPVKKKVVFLDIGHGGSDPGAQYYGVREKDLNLQIGLKLQRDLINAGYDVIMSRTADVYIDHKTERSKMANSSNADTFLSLHNNAMPNNSTVNGIETFYYEYDPNYQPAINKDKHNDPTRVKESANLAQSVHGSLIKATGAYNRGVRRDTFAVLRETAIPAVLLEFGFMSNSSELNKLKTNSYQNALSKAVMSGVNNYFNNK